MNTNYILGNEKFTRQELNDEFTAFIQEQKQVLNTVWKYVK